MKGLEALAESAALALVALVTLAAGIVLLLLVPSLPCNEETNDPVALADEDFELEDKSGPSCRQQVVMGRH